MKIGSSIFVILVSILLLPSCRKSVLSELEIDSPAALKVKVKIEEKTRKRRWIQVEVRDKTNHIIEFSNGGVFINDDPTEFSSKTVVSISRGYTYRVPGGIDAFDIVIQWNETDSYAFTIAEDAGFPGFSNYVGYNWTQGSKKFSITPTPFADGKIVVEYDILK